ncbi:MAG: hypothetical protein J7K36_03650, partial [Archaeoglobaceae archaeon]|nr:hypothetical protein [Archaeoglobaceae archaeon]
LTSKLVVLYYGIRIFVKIFSEKEQTSHKIHEKIKGLFHQSPRCTKCKPSKNWLGNYSSKKQIRTSGLWLTQHLNAKGMTTNGDILFIEKLIQKTKKWIETRWR